MGEASGWLRTSELSEQQRQRLAALLAPQPWFDFYYQCALDDWRERGLDNRSFVVGRAGAILAIHFDEATIASAVGELSSAELARMLDRPDRGELHLEDRHVAPMLALVGPRLRRRERLRYYYLEPLPEVQIDPRCRRVRSDDFEVVGELFARFYPETILSRWMLDLPFVGVWEDGELRAAAGTLVINQRLAACHVGNFLTHPEHRGRGLAKVAARGLVSLLRAEGMGTCMLGVYDSNEPAWRAYERLGFELYGTRELIYLEPAGG